MLTPSYSELMDVIKQSEKMDSRVTIRYTVVLAAAKRARQLTDGANPLTYAPTDRAVSIAVKEMNEGKLRIKIQDELLDVNYERMIKDNYRYRTAVSRDDLREDLKQDYTTVTYDMDNDDDGFRDDPYQETAAVAEKDDDFNLYEETAVDELDAGEIDIDSEENDSEESE